MPDQSPKNESAPSGSGKISGAVCCVAVCALIGFLAYLLTTRPQPSQARRLWLPVVVETNGNEAILGDTRQFEFWTPSAKTKDFLAAENGQVPANEQWEAIAGDDTVLKFGEVLHSNRNVLGFRRVEVWGQGRTTFKPGWWWTVNVYSNYSVGEMGHFYQDFWKSSQAVFFEVIDNRGHTE